ncbi:MAG: DUF4143 domain-containing protein [Actinobacteria bacterium]|nr:DUF4143 domain-containing protein [Actinomycetota bacterium]
MAHRRCPAAPADHRQVADGGDARKVAAIANELGIDARTVNRYLDVLERRFLVTELPNLRQPLKQSSRSTAKAYPADVALSTAYATASGRQLDHEQVRGGVFEALVAQQLRAHLGWTEAGGELVHGGSSTLAATSRWTSPSWTPQAVLSASRSRLGRAPKPPTSLACAS